MSVTLHDGRVIKLDLYRMTRADWRDFIDPKGKPEVEVRVVAAVTGLTEAEVDALAWLDFRAIVAALVTAARGPIDPNSQSASISA